MQTMAYEFPNVYEAFRFPPPNLAAFAIRPQFFCFQTPEIRFIFFCSAARREARGRYSFCTYSLWDRGHQDFGLEE